MGCHITNSTKLIFRLYQALKSILNLTHNSKYTKMPKTSSPEPKSDATKTISTPQFESDPENTPQNDSDSDCQGESEISAATARSRLLGGMSVVGIDLGNLNNYVAVARQGGVEVITNDYSLHATPSCVVFTDRQRVVGVAAKQIMSSRLGSAVTNFKDLIGRQHSDNVVQLAKEWVPCEIAHMQDGGVGLKVNYLNEDRVFTPEQISAIVMLKLKNVTELFFKDTNYKVTDCVISVPCFYTDLQRRRILDAAKLADLNVLKIINQTTAVALAYGIYKQDLPAENEKPKRVLFLDVGHAATQACVAAFSKGKLQMQATAYDVNCGGRDFDKCIAQKFAEEFKQKYKIDALSRRKSWFRLLDEVEKIKKQMSANSNKLPLNIECFMDDKDVTATIQRDEFEQLAAHLLQKVEAVIKSAMADAKISSGEVDAVELVGGSSRIPAIKAMVSRLAGKEPTTTMNMDEAVARGCAMQCAILSPTFRVREFNVSDAQPFRIQIEFKTAENSDEMSMMDVFEEQHPFPYSKMLTFYRSAPFAIDARYGKPNLVPQQHTKLGRWIVDGVTPSKEGESRKVKVKIRLNNNGIFSVSSAAAYETVPAGENDKNEETVKEKNVNGEPMETDPGASQQESTESGEKQTSENAENDQQSMETDEPSKGDKKGKKGGTPKTKTVAIDLPVKDEIPSRWEKSQIEALKKMELEMRQRDQSEKDKADARNAVEEYIYEMRDKLSDAYEPFVTQKDADELRGLLQATEDWLYEDEDEVDKSVFLDKLDKLKKLGEPIAERFRESEARKPAIDFMGRTLQQCSKLIAMYDAKDAKYDHLESKDVDRVRKCLEQKQIWFDDVLNRQKAKPLTQPPVATAEAFYTEAKAVQSVSDPVFNRPKPKPKTPPPPPAEAEPAPPGGEKAQAAPPDDAAQHNGDVSMDGDQVPIAPTI